MHVEIKIDSTQKKPKVIILTASITEEVNSILKRLSDPPNVLSGIKDGKVEILEPENIIRIYAGAAVRPSWNGLCLSLRDMGNRTLEHRPADRHIFSRGVRSNAACRIPFILDGAQHQGLHQIHGNLRTNLYRHVDNTVHYCKAQC